MSYAKGGVLPGYQNPVPTQENMNKSSRGTRQMAPPKYNSVSELLDAYRKCKEPYGGAYYLLTTQFAMSDKDATDLLSDITTNCEPCEGEYVPPIGPEQIPGDFDGDGIPNEQDCDHYVVQEDDATTDDDDDDSSASIPMTDNQRFLLIGALVIAIGSRMIIKRD
ncbi:MAG: hypothetical protein DWQ49_13945 [Bacteroidetes bacterium]|nr:MAG: hypothetical protein DWQ49_13945 [Bacteroidota bacterium]